MKSPLILPALGALGVWCLFFAIGWRFLAPFNPRSRSVR